MTDRIVVGPKAVALKSSSSMNDGVPKAAYVEYLFFNLNPQLTLNPKGYVQVGQNLIHPVGRVCVWDTQVRVPMMLPIHSCLDCLE